MTSRALRIGVLIGDTLVEEQLVDAATPITFGQSLRCTISVPADGVPREHVLFTRDGDAFVLHVAGQPPQPLARGARGKLRVGDATVLYQEVARAVVPVPVLPRELRGSLADRIDRRLATIVGASLALHVAIAAWAWTHDAGAPLLDTPLSGKFERATIDVADVIDAPKPGAAVPVAPTVQTPARIVQPTRVTVPHRPDEPVRLEDAARLASILAGPDADETGVGSMGHRRPSADLAQQLDDARHHRVTIGDGTPTSREGREALGTDDHGLPIHEQATDRIHAPDAVPERGRVHLDGLKSEEKTTLTAQLVLDKINALYMAGLQRCYRKGLALDAHLGGTVAISFTVDEAGRVTEPDAEGIDPQVDHCITSQMATWRFTAPRDAKGERTDTTFHVSLALQPS
ncbi:MAG: AgmX/PglI C-terminal domain-containing protein [Acidobacteriota bacterium]